MDKNTVLHGDCLELMKDITDKSIDMILCDLPYGTTACSWDVVIPFEPLWEQYKRIIKDKGAIVLFGSEPFSSYLRLSNIKNYKYDWVWKKTRPVGHLQAKKQPLKDIENILLFYKNQCKYYPQGIVDVDIINHNTPKRLKSSGMGKVIAGEYYTQTKSNYPRRVLEFNSEHNVGEFVHPTQKPVALFEYLIKTYTNEGDLVLDNCAGSGTTAIACLNTKRNYILMEKEQKYYNVINKRIKDWKANEQLTIGNANG